MNINPNTLRAALVVASGTLMGCDWFAGPPCMSAEESCDGDKIRVCTAKPSSAAGSGNATEYEWSTVRSCGAEAQRGTLTCSVLNGRAQCVPERPEDGDGGVLSEARWVRVVVKRDGDRLSLGETDEQVLPADIRPLGASSGSVAIVGYADGTPVDATLVRFADRAVLGSTGAVDASPVKVRGAEQVVWLQAQGVDQIKLVTPRGLVVAEQSLSAGVAATSQPSNGRKVQALSAQLPPTLRVLEPSDVQRIPTAVRSQMGVPVTPTANMLTLVSAALARAPALATAAVTSLGFLSFDRQQTDEVGDVGGVGGAPETENVRAAGGPSTARVGTMLLVNVSDGWLEVYRHKPYTLALDLLHQLALAYSSLATAPSATEPAPEDYPEEVARLIQRRLSPMLAPREGLKEAWGAIHQVGVDAKLAGVYFGTAWERRDAGEAIHDGFFSPLGGFDAEHDFAETVARLHVPEVWSGRSPCDVLSASSLSKLDPRWMVPLAKVELAHGLGLVSDEVRARCLGSLAQDEAPGIVLYTPSGVSMAFDNGLQATLQPYLHGEMHLTMLGVRHATTALVEVGYRGAGVGVHRLLAAPARPDPEIGAGMYLANPHAYDSTFSTDGLIVITRMDRERVSARGLLVRQKKEMLGETIWPLVTVRIDKLERLEGL